MKINIRAGRDLIYLYIRIDFLFSGTKVGLLELHFNNCPWIAYGTYRTKRMIKF